jgi:hypothetical protein
VIGYFTEKLCWPAVVGLGTTSHLNILQSKSELLINSSRAPHMRWKYITRSAAHNSLPTDGLAKPHSDIHSIVSGLRLPCDGFRGFDLSQGCHSAREQGKSLGVDCPTVIFGVVA